MPSRLPATATAMAATATDRRFSGPEWIFEEKLDGYRCLAWVEDGTARLRSRNDKNFDGAFPEVVEALPSCVRGSALLDGEVVAFEDGRSDFGLLQQRAGLRDARRARATNVAITYVVFDILFADGEDLRSKDLLTRKAVLARVVEPRGPVTLSTWIEEDGLGAFDEACRRGLEGVIAKRAASTYQPRRSRDWLKMKCTASQELVVVGFTDPKGARPGFGALLLGYYDDEGLRYAGKVGTGFDDETLRSIRPLLDDLQVETPPVLERVREPGAHWVLPALVAQVRFSGWGGDGSLRHPGFIGFRADKAPEDVVREPG